MKVNISGLMFMVDKVLEDLKHNTRGIEIVEKWIAEISNDWENFINFLQYF